MKETDIQYETLTKRQDLKLKDSRRMFGTAEEQQLRQGPICPLHHRQRQRHRFRKNHSVNVCIFDETWDKSDSTWHEGYIRGEGKTVLVVFKYLSRSLL